MVELAHTNLNPPLNMCDCIFFSFILGFNRQYSFSGKRRARRKQIVSGDFNNVVDLLTQFFRDAHM